MITSDQCIAARALLRWKQADLSNAIQNDGSKLSVTAITAFERGGAIRKNNALLIEIALTNAGVLFIAENGGGEGVRLARPKPKPAN